MAKARNFGAADNGRSRRKAALKANESKGVPIPGTGVNRWNWRGKSQHKNRAGAIKSHLTWSEDPIHDAQDRNLNNAARHEAIDEQIGDLVEVPEEWDLHLQELDEESAGMYTVYSGGLAPDILFNGLAYSDDTFGDWGPNEPDYTSRLAIEMVENARLRNALAAALDSLRYCQEDSR